MDSLLVDSLLVSIPADSTGAFEWLGKVFPGLSPAIIALIAGWLGTRGIWLLKGAIWVVKTLGPNVLAVPFKQILNLWHNLGWLINPILMVLIGTKLTGGDWGLGTLIGFAGIGVKEWLVKSPIPTNMEELKKMKARVGILFVFALCLLLPVAVNAETMPKWVTSNTVFSVGGGVAVDFQDEEDTVEDRDMYPFIAVRLGYVLSPHFKLEAEPSFILHKDQYIGLRFGGYIIF